jgi:hypothetical protein
MQCCVVNFAANILRKTAVVKVIYLFVFALMVCFNLSAQAPKHHRHTLEHEHLDDPASTPSDNILFSAYPSSPGKIRVQLHSYIGKHVTVMAVSPAGNVVAKELIANCNEHTSIEIKVGRKAKGTYVVKVINSMLKQMRFLVML